MTTTTRAGSLAGPDDHAFRTSYLVTRAVVGILGIVLPVLLILGEYLFLRSGVQVRGSLSAYYHTAMRDLFVAGLAVIAFMLLTYMSGKWGRADFVLSLVAGGALLGVVVFPTTRPGLAPGAAECGTTPEPAGCAPVQQLFGESVTAGIHFVCAAVFILSLCVNCLWFAREERGRGQRRSEDLQRLCAGVIAAAVVWVALGAVVDLTFWGLTPLYVGEVVAVWAFAASWLWRARDLVTGP